MHASVLLRAMEWKKLVAVIIPRRRSTLAAAQERLSHSRVAAQVTRVK